MRRSGQGLFSDAVPLLRILLIRRISVGPGGAPHRCDTSMLLTLNVARFE